MQFVAALDRVPGGGKSISFQQEIGQSWNRVEHLADAQSRFETALVLPASSTARAVNCCQPSGRLLVL